MTTYLIEMPDKTVGSCVTTCILKLIILLCIITNYITWVGPHVMAAKHTSKTKFSIAESIQKHDPED